MSLYVVPGVGAVVYDMEDPADFFNLEPLTGIRLFPRRSRTTVAPAGVLGLGADLRLSERARLRFETTAAIGANALDDKHFEASARFAELAAAEDMVRSFLLTAGVAVVLGGGKREAPVTHAACVGELDVCRTETVAAMSRLSRDSLRQRTGADLLVGRPHRGVEFRHCPTPYTRFLARRLGDALCAHSRGKLLGPPSLLATWPTRLVSVPEVRVTPAGLRCGSAISYRLHPFVQAGRAYDASLAPLANATVALRSRLARWLEILCPCFEGASDRRLRPRGHPVGT